MLRRIRRVLSLSRSVTVGALLALAVPAGAQQLVDAGKEGDGSGGLAFVLMVVDDRLHRRVAVLHGPRAPQSSAAGRRQPVAPAGPPITGAPLDAQTVLRKLRVERAPTLCATRVAELGCRRQGFVDLFVVVGEAHEQRLVAAGGEEVRRGRAGRGRAARSARGRPAGPVRSSCTGVGGEEEAGERADLRDLRVGRAARCARPSAKRVGLRLERRRSASSSSCVEHGEAGGGGERVPATACRPGTRGRAGRARP